MSVLRDVEAAVTVVPGIVCNSLSGLDIVNMVVEHNETEEEQERIAWFLKVGACASWYIAHYAPCTQFITLLLQEARNECR